MASLLLGAHKKQKPGLQIKVNPARIPIIWAGSKNVSKIE
jgi:hypothetical protein